MLDHCRDLGEAEGLVWQPVQTKAEMHITSPEDIAVSFHRCSVAPQDCPSKEHSMPTCMTIQPALVRKAKEPPSPKPNRLNLFHRRTSSLASTRSRTGSFYAGPMPTRHDGCPLKSCLKKPSFIGDSPSASSSCFGRRVSFSHVQLREYCRQVGDNPSVSSGCPLAIGWKYNRRGTIDIDSFEADRDKNPTPCQRLSAKEREKLLSEIGGASHTQIIRGQIQAYFDWQQRSETLDQIGGLKNYKSVGPRERLLIMRESAARKLDRAKKGTSHDQEQQKLWDDAHEVARRKSLDSEHSKSP